MKKKYGSHELEVTNLAKVFFPKDGYTKGDIVDYYDGISEVMLPYSENRPLTLIRYPNGIHGESFFQQQASEYFPEWIKRVEVPKKGGGEIEHAVLQKKEDLIYLVNLGCITFHIWLSTVEDLKRPDRMIFDFDPSNEDFSLVRKGALYFKEALEALDLAPFAMLTGSRGIHLVVPIKREMEFEGVRDFARQVAISLVKKHPHELTMEASKEKRGNRLLVDIIRNSYGQTHATPYGVRAKDGAPVAAPISWEEVKDKDLRPQKFNIKNTPKRLEKGHDPWEDFLSSSRSIKNAMGKL